MKENPCEEGERSYFQTVPGGVATVSGNKTHENNSGRSVRNDIVSAEEVYSQIGLYLPRELQVSSPAEFNRKWANFPNYREKCTKLFFCATGHSSE